MNFGVSAVFAAAMSLVLAGCTATAAAPAAKKSGTGVRNAVSVPPVPSVLNVRGAASGGAENAPAGLYYGGELVVPNVTDANISPDGMHALWQNDDKVFLYSVKLRKQRQVASNLPAAILEVTWNAGSIRLKLANTGEFFIDNME